MRFVAALILLTLAGCCAAPAPCAPTVYWSRSLAGGIASWRAAFVRQYHAEPVILVCHGADHDGRWVLHTDSGRYLDTESVVAALHEVFKGRTVLVLSCNVGHHRLHTLGAVYALDSIWSRPGPAKQFCIADWREETAVGDIRQFVRSGQ